MLNIRDCYVDFQQDTYSPTLRIFRTNRRINFSYDSLLFIINIYMMRKTYAKELKIHRSFDVFFCYLNNIEDYNICDMLM